MTDEDIADLLRCDVIKIPTEGFGIKIAKAILLCSLRRTRGISNAMTFDCRFPRSDLYPRIGVTRFEDSESVAWSARRVARTRLKSELSETLWMNGGS